MNNRRKIRSIFSKFSLSTVKVLFQLKNNFVDADNSTVIFYGASVPSITLRRGKRKKNLGRSFPSSTSVFSSFSLITGLVFPIGTGCIDGA